jgi:uncharacterized protein (DUF1697 family)
MRGIVMQKYLALLRGINVGGVVLKMDDLKVMMGSIGLKNIRTYIQSGNAVFETGKTDKMNIEKDIERAIEKESGLKVAVLVKTGDELKKIISLHPFKDESEVGKVYFTLLKKRPDRNNLELMDKMKGSQDRFVLKDDVIYSYYTNGYGKSKFTNNFFEDRLNVPCTTRNLNTMTRLSEMM